MKCLKRLLKKVAVLNTPQYAVLTIMMILGVGNMNLVFGQGKTLIDISNIFKGKAPPDESVLRGKYQIKEISPNAILENYLVVELQEGPREFNNAIYSAPKKSVTRPSFSIKFKNSKSYDHFKDLVMSPDHDLIFNFMQSRSIDDGGHDYLNSYLNTDEIWILPKGEAVNKATNLGSLEAVYLKDLRRGRQRQGDYKATEIFQKISDWVRGKGAYADIKEEVRVNDSSKSIVKPKAVPGERPHYKGGGGQDSSSGTGL